MNLLSAVWHRISAASLALATLLSGGIVFAPALLAQEHRGGGEANLVLPDLGTVSFERDTASSQGEIKSAVLPKRITAPRPIRHLSSECGGGRHAGPVPLNDESAIDRQRDSIRDTGIDHAWNERGGDDHGCKPDCRSPGCS